MTSSHALRYVAIEQKVLHSVCLHIYIYTIFAHLYIIYVCTFIYIMHCKVCGNRTKSVAFCMSAHLYIYNILHFYVYMFAHLYMHCTARYVAIEQKVLHSACLYIYTSVILAFVRINVCTYIYALYCKVCGN